MKGRKYNDWPANGMGYIYAIVHPTTEEVRYIGQTSKSLQYRLRAHINSALISTSNSRKTPVGKWMFKLLSNNLIPRIIQIEYLPVSKLNESEIAHIKEGRLKHRLLNIAEGGIIASRRIGTKQPKSFSAKQSLQRSGVGNQNFVDLSGMRFNKLTVVWLSGFKLKRSYWLCKCDCGNLKIVSATKLKRIKSCGCAKRTRWTQEERKKYSEYDKKFRNRNVNGQFKRDMAIVA